MKQLLITITAVLLVGCGESWPPEPPTVAPYISIHDAADVETLKLSNNTSLLVRM